MITYRILFAEDIADDMELAERELRRAGLKFVSKRVETRKDFIDELWAFKPDVVISDYSMPGFNGMEAVKIVLELSPFTPVIIHTGSINEETAVNCMKAGAYDYILKDKILRLPFAIRDAYQKSIILKQNRESQIALKVSEEKYKGLFNSIAQGVFYVDENQKISMLNPAALNILMMEDRFCETIKQLYNEWTLKTENGDLFDLTKFISKPQHQLRHVNINHIVHAHHKKTKIEKWLQTDIIHESDLDDSLPSQILVIIEDITQQRKSVIELIQAKERAEESDKLKSAFLSNLSHEVRTPMNAILGFAELLAEEYKIDENEKFYIDTIRSNSTKLLEIITDIIEISKIETEQVTTRNSEFDLIELHSFIKDIFASISLSAKISLSVKGFEPDIRLITDEQKIKKVLYNLLDNAIKFTDQGEISVSCLLKPGLIEIHIQDSGIGIPAELKDKIFERFRQADESFSRKYGGTGLGLSIAKAYVNAMGGSIWYKSCKNGTDFAFKIPVNWSYTKIGEGLIDILTSPDYSEYTVLIAEDDNTNFAYLSRILKPTGIKILYASDGIDAIDQFKENPQINVILMDIKMPLMNGYEATRIIRQTDQMIPIIATTAYAMNGDKEKCLEAGCNSYISKPIRKIDLYNTLNKYLSRR